MARSGRAAGSAKKAGDAASALRGNSYVQRLIEDQELRDNIRDAYKAARHAYTRVANGKGPARSLMEDKKVHRDLRTAAESLREASDQLQGKRRKRRWGKLLLVAIVGAGVALAFSEDVRKAVLDRLFGAEEEFEYSSTTSAPEQQTATQA